MSKLLMPNESQHDFLWMIIDNYVPVWSGFWDTAYQKLSDLKIVLLRSPRVKDLDAKLKATYDFLL